MGLKLKGDSSFATDEGGGSFNKSVDKMASYKQSKLVLNFELMRRF